MAGQVSHTYDREADVLYLTFGTGEPSFTESVDDFILFEIGFFSRRITGLRVIGLLKHGPDEVTTRLSRVIEQASKRAAQECEKETKRVNREALRAVKSIPDLVEA